MKQDVNNIDNLFREGLGGYTEVPPPDVWDALERRLDNDKKKRPFAWRWFFVMLCGVGLFGSLFAWKMNGHSGTTPGVAEASGIASIQQPPVEKQATTPGNTSAGSNASTTSITHKKHVKRTNDINSTKNNSGNEQSQSTNVAVNNSNSNITGSANRTTKTDLLDNTTVAMVNVEPTPGTEHAPIRYVTNNKSRNNIVATETEPAYNNTTYNTAEDGEEDNVTFGRKPRVENNEPAPRNTYAASASYEGRPVVAGNHYGNRTSITSIPTKHTANRRSVLPAPSSTSNQVVTTNPRKRNSRRSNGGSNSNPYSITNNTGTMSAIAHTPAATKPAAGINTAATTAKTVTVNKPIKTEQKTVKAEPATRTTDVETASAKPVQNTNPVATKTEQTTASTVTTTHLKKAVVKTTATKSTAVVAVNVPVKKTAKKKVTTTTETKPVVAATVPAVKTVAKTSTTASVKQSQVATKPTDVVTKQEYKTTQHKATTAATVAQLASGKKAVNNNEIAAVTPTPSVNNKKKHGGKYIAATTPVIGTQSGATTIASKDASATTSTVVKKNVKTAVAKNTKDDVADNGELTVGRVAKNKKQAPKTAQTATNKALAQNNKKHKNNNKPEPPNVLSATSTANKLPEPTTVAQTKPLVTPETQKVMSTFKDAQTPSIKPAETVALPVPAAATAGVDSPTQKHKFGGFTYGVKVGYEGGVTSDASRKFVISPFIERQISSKFSLMAQPSIKSSAARTNGLSGTQTFYRTDPNGTVTNVDSFLIPVIQNNQTTGYLLRINVAYHETHDSIVKSYATGGNYMEFELPIMLKYAINNKLSVYGGLSLNYSKYIQVQEHTYTSRPIVRNDTSFTIYPTAPAPISSVLQYAGNNINSYSGPLYPVQSGGLFRLGCMLGVSYEIRKRWLVDALWTKAPTKTNVQGGYDVNKGLSTSYFRLTLGYRLSK
ncbi:hypothetical protein CJD36_015465 [Flavipsychrobacter stenotrophus]|uniref:Outer membrane protein beta-barrel domain-containing protein n=1 Tax=Flavipsychrobacter stenotrophus TaxID=2077091 RepID=A0A2S7STM8_9BACT|nr:hypothetical protein [Flavipsychrobacter stenotrophus]PQJ10094.1 hypothetical protein CJD36_015465 [Flavipsychrobacter stenotrophus]